MYMGVHYQKNVKILQKISPPHKPAYIAFVTFFKTNYHRSIYLFKNKIWFYRNKGLYICTLYIVHFKML